MECSSVRHSSLGLATLLMAIGCSDGFLFDESVFTEVLSVCPETADGTVLLTINTDASDTFPFAACYDDYVYDFDPVHMGSWTLEAVLNTDAPENQCMFKKQENSEIYYLYVTVPTVDEDIYFGDEFDYLVNCSYETEPTELLDSSLIDSKKPVEQRMTNHGILSDSDVKVTVVDYAGEEITETLRVGRYIKLHAELLGNTSDVESFQAVACDVFTPPDLYYNIITGGCGDGTIVDRNAGFLTTGREAYSPLFEVFRVARITPELTFNCTFIVCNDTCDGSSCELSRKRRGSETVEELASSERYIQTSIVAKVDPEPEKEAIRIDVREPSLTHERKHTAIQRPPAVEIEFMDSETIKNLQVSLVLMVIVSVLCTLTAMLMTLYLLWVALSTAYQLASAKGRGTLAVIKDSTEI